MTEQDTPIPRSRRGLRVAAIALGVVLAANVAAYFVVPRILNGPVDLKASGPAPQGAGAAPSVAGETPPERHVRPAPGTIDLFAEAPEGWWISTLVLGRL